MCGSVDQDGGSLSRAFASRRTEGFNRLGLRGVVRMTLFAEVTRNKLPVAGYRCWQRLKGGDASN